LFSRDRPNTSSDHAAARLSTQSSLREVPIQFEGAEYAGKRKKTRPAVFLDKMEQVVSWKMLLNRAALPARRSRPQALSAGVNSAVHMTVSECSQPLRADHEPAAGECLARVPRRADSGRRDPGCRGARIASHRAAGRIAAQQWSRRLKAEAAFQLIPPKQGCHRHLPPPAASGINLKCCPASRRNVWPGLLNTQTPNRELPCPAEECRRQSNGADGRHRCLGTAKAYK
jgi:hypothetical protein